MSSWFAMPQDAAEMSVFLAVESSLLFIVISAGVSPIRQKMPDHKIQRMMGARRGRGYFLIALLGAATPFCSCSAIPMLRGLLSAKVGFGSTLTFLFVPPLLNPIIAELIWMIFGREVILLYVIIAAGVSVLANIILDSLGFERRITASKSSLANCCVLVKTLPGTTYTPIKVSRCSLAAEAIENPVVTYYSTKTVVSINPMKLAIKGALQQSKDILPYLSLGVLIGSSIYGFIPSAWIAAHAGADNPFAIPLSTIAGIPLYIRAEVVIPLAPVLMTKGMGLGALMALIIGSAGASLTEVILPKSMFRVPMIAAFLMVVLGMTTLIGYLTQLLF